MTKKPKTSAIAKIKSKAVRKYFLQFNRLTIKKGVLHQLYIDNDVECHLMVLPLEYQGQVLCLLHDGQGDQGIELTFPYAGRDITSVKVVHTTAPGTLRN